MEDAKRRRVTESPIEEESAPADPDLSEWPDYWRRPTARRVLSFYHKRGAPFLDDDGESHAAPPPEEYPVHQPTLGVHRPAPTPAERTPSEGRAPPPPPGAEGGIAATPTVPLPAEGPSLAATPAAPADPPVARSRRPVGQTFEHIAHFLTSTFFPDGIHLPVRKDGLVDLDVILREREVVVDVHRLWPQFPVLAVWRITLAYQGRPLVTMGQGVQGHVKVRPLRVLVTLFRVWLQTLEAQKAHSRAPKRPPKRLRWRKRSEIRPPQG